MDLNKVLPKLKTSERIEFADVRNLVSLKQLTDYLAIQLSKRNETEFRGNCPKCNKVNLAINLESNYFKCFTKGCLMKGSGVIDFMNKGYSINNSVTSAHILACIFQILIYEKKENREVVKNEIPAAETSKIESQSTSNLTPFELEILKRFDLLIEEVQTIVRHISKTDK